jgi:ABC-2 type transport system permease protein
MTALVTDPTGTSRPAARTVKASVSIREALTQITTLAWRALIRIRRNPEQLVDVTATPALFTVMFGLIFGGAISGGTAHYLPTLVPGIIAMSTMVACVATGVQFREDMDKGVFDRFRSLPIARIAPLAGPMLADLARYAIASSITLTVGVIMGYRPDGGVLGVLAGIVLAVITGWSLAWIFVSIGTKAMSASAVQGISFMVMFPLAFVSNAFIPVNTLPGWLQAVTWVNPVSHIVSALRDLMNKGAFTAQVGWALLGCAAVGAIFIPLAVRSYSKRV